ncbi:hypothetical protein PSY31_23205, partial [Shigella flexneri]|nr:hypothetical protein [Shigella flexneri]
MIWGYMLWEGSENMCKIDGLMDQHLYTEILEKDLLQTLVEYGKTPESVIFTQDNDPKQTSKARKFLRSFSRRSPLA